MNSALMVSRSGLQHAAVASYAYKLQCLKSQVWQISRERDKARLDLEKAERHCLQLSRELDKQYIALKHSQSKLKDVQTEMEAKELLLQQAINHQVKLQADAQFLQGKEATLRGRLNLMMKENTQLQNKVMEMGEKLTASEKLVLELQKELSLVVKDKLSCCVTPPPHFEFSCILMATWKEELLCFSLGLSEFERRNFTSVENSTNLKFSRENWMFKKILLNKY